MMRLNVDNLIYYLRDHKLIPPEELLQGRWHWDIMPGRNTIIKVRKKGAAGLFLKQLAVVDAEKVVLIEREAAINYLLNHMPDFKGMKAYLPRFYSYDNKQHVLVSEFVPESCSVLELIEIKGVSTTQQAERMVDILSAYHLPVADKKEAFPQLKAFDGALPWALRFPKESPSVQDGLLALASQDQQIVAGLQKAAQLWTSGYLIHGDIKLMNFIVSPDEQGEMETIKLIDWELANIGDPIWDLAGLWQSYVVSGIANMVGQGQNWMLPTQKQYWSETANDRIWYAIWQRYRKNQGWNGQEQRQQLEKLLYYTAARTFQSAVELNQVSPDYIDGRSAIMLNTARALFAAPQSIIKRMLTSTN